MVRLARGALAALVLGLAVGAAGAQTSGWLPGWLGGKPAPRPEDKAPSLEDKAKKVPDQKAALDTLMNTYLRRLAVCDRLREVALESDDHTLAEEADRLEALAWQLCNGRSGKLLGAGSVGLADDPKVDHALDETRDMLMNSAGKGKQPPARRTPGEGER